MDNPRKYGTPPYLISIVHGGPGLPGQVAPIAKELSKEFGVLEPLQTASSLKGQIIELTSYLSWSFLWSNSFNTCNSKLS